MSDTTAEATSPRKYYPIDEDLARRAHEMMSFRPYTKGRRTSEYRRMVDSAYELAERQKARTEPIYHGHIDRLLDTYARRLAKNINEASRIGCMCPSVMIAGGSNFPVRKKEKQNAADEANMKDFMEVQGILDKIRGAGTAGIRSDDPDALEKLRKKIATLQELQQQMKAANAAVRLKDKEKGDKRLAELGYTQDEIDRLRTPDFCGTVGYPAYALSNNNANIRRLQKRVEELERRRDDPAPEGWEFGLGKVVVNTDISRVQIVLAARPDDEFKLLLKTHGFHWSPSNGAWQRLMTDNAIRAAKSITEGR